MILLFDGRGGERHWNLDVKLVLVISRARVTVRRRRHRSFDGLNLLENRNNVETVFLSRRRNDRCLQSTIERNRLIVLEIDNHPA